MSKATEFFDAAIADRINWFFRRGKPKADAQKDYVRWIKSLDERGTVEVVMMLEEFHSLLMRDSLGDHDGICCCDCRLAEMLRRMRNTEKRERVA
jgi:hypothetical protein